MEFVEVEHATGPVVAALCEKAGKKCVGMQRVAAGIEVGQQKRGFFGRIDPAEGGLELHAVEGDEPSVDPHDVACVQIAVAFAHSPVFKARHHMRLGRIEPRRDPGAQFQHLPVATKNRCRSRALLDILKDECAHRRGPAPRVRIAGDGQS